MGRKGEFTVARRRRAERRIWLGAYAASLVLHVLVLFLWRADPFIPRNPFGAAGPAAGDDRAALGGMQALSLAIPPSRPIIPPRVPLPTVTLEDPVVFEPEVDVDMTSLVGTGQGNLEGAGVPGGTGSGGGGTGESGRRAPGLVPPSPRGMILPPTNRNLRGRRVEVWVFVNEEGRVVADSTRLSPPTPDRDFNRRLIREAAEWVFNPALQDGRPVASWFPYTISM